MLCRPTFAIIALLCGFCTGCGHYEYDLTQPGDLARHIGTKADEIVAIDPLEYRFISFSDHLILRIFNTTDDSIQLLGQQSTAVDPNGQSHPFRPQAIAPHSFIKLILPPLRPTLQRTGPSVGFGLGFIVRSDRGRRVGRSEDDDFYDSEPQYFDVVDDDALYWNWDGESQVRVIFMFQRGEKTFTQSFVFRRVKV